MRERERRKISTVRFQNFRQKHEEERIRRLAWAIHISITVTKWCKGKTEDFMIAIFCATACHRSISFFRKRRYSITEYPKSSFALSIPKSAREKCLMAEKEKFCCYLAFYFIFYFLFYALLYFNPFEPLQFSFFSCTTTTWSGDHHRVQEYTKCHNIFTEKEQAIVISNQSIMR